VIQANVEDVIICSCHVTQINNPQEVFDFLHVLVEAKIWKFSLPNFHSNLVLHFKATTFSFMILKDSNSLLYLCEDRRRQVPFKSEI
jgi:hypothetical protein